VHLNISIRFGIRLKQKLRFFGFALLTGEVERDQGDDKRSNRNNLSEWHGAAGVSLLSA
jgi:hypothetical protein